MSCGASRKNVEILDCIIITDDILLIEIVSDTFTLSIPLD